MSPTSRIQQSQTASTFGGRRVARRGFTLVETLVALALFGISMSAIAALTFAVTRQGADTEEKIERTTAVEARINDLYSIPWTAINARVGCTTITAQPFPRQECITITNTSATRKTVTLTITPTDPAVHATSVTLERTAPPAGNPFRVAP